MTLCEIITLEKENKMHMKRKKYRSNSHASNRAELMRGPFNVNKTELTFTPPCELPILIYPRSYRHNECYYHHICLYSILHLMLSKRV